MRRAELVTAIILAVFSVYIMWKSGQPAWEGEPRFDNIRYVRGEGPGSGFWPFYLAGIMLVSSIWIIVNWARRISPPSRSDAKFLDEYGVSMLVKVGGGVTAMIGMVHFIGMYGSMIVFLFYYLHFLGRHRLRTTLAVALGAPVGTFFFFDVAMRIVLPKGYLEPLFIPLYDIFL
jgi:putative tricarboxylic transport membrane protein